MPTKTLAWRSYTIAPGPLSVDLVDGPKVDEGDVANVHYVLQSHPPVRLDVWLGPGVSIDWWRARVAIPDASIGPEAKVPICGMPALRQQVLVPEQRAVGFVDLDVEREHIEQHTPAELHVAVAGMLASGRGRFVISWRVAAAERERLRGDELHYFASIKCRPN